MSRNNVLDYNGFVNEKLKIQPISKESLENISNGIAKAKSSEIKKFWIYAGQNGMYYVSDIELDGVGGIVLKLKTDRFSTVEEYINDFEDESFAFSINLLSLVKNMYGYLDEEETFDNHIFFNTSTLEFVENIDDYYKIRKAKQKASKPHR